MSWNEWALAFTGDGLEDPQQPRLDRAAHLRLDDGWQAGAKVLPVWRGKVLLADGGGLAFLPVDHVALADASPVVLLGLVDGQAVAAQDISAWTPPNLAETQLFLDPTAQRHPDIPGAGFVELRGIMADLAPAESEIAATARALTGWHLSHRFCAACGHESAAAQSGWQRRCPSCQATHFPRTDPVVIMLVEKDDRLLLGRSPGWPEGMYSCLAGFVEPGETIEAAVRREVAEETGVVVGPVAYAACQPWPFPSSLMFGCIARAETDRITRDEVEIEDALWLPRAEVERVMAGDHPRIRAPRQGPIAGWLIARWVAGRLSLGTN